MTTNANMTVCDANVVLRYLLQDNEILSEKAILIIENKDVFVTTEVIAEIIYVLNKVYQMPRELGSVDISFSATLFLKAFK
ncbi:PIN domain-containing protein [Moraxella boevrei]|uniref:PIN domain-containing protein n=1 Tax=Faucicola boevrei TaxID=346665 RepID=UPI003734E077